MHKGILLSSVIALSFLSCNDNKADTIKQEAIVNASLVTGSVTGAVPPGQDCAKLKAAYASLDSSKKELELMFDAALVRLDSVVYYNAELEKKLTERNSDIEKLKRQVRALSDKRSH